MMGERAVRQEALFYGFNLDDHVPADHLLRSIDRFVELADIRRELAPYYSAIGRPSIDPELMIRMLLIGYCCGIRSERRLCDEVHLNLAYRWFCRLGLTDPVPNHSTFTKNRHGRFRDSDLLRRLFEATVRRCMAEGIVGGQGFAVDASMIRADAHRQKGVASRDELDPEDTTRAVTEYLAVLDDAAFGAATEVAPKFISPTDPAARWTAAAGGPACYAYCDNYLIDIRHAVIVDVEATTAVRQAEVGAAQTMLTRTAERFGLWPERLVADTGYGSAAMLAWLVHEQGIEPHIPVFDKSTRKDGTFSRSDFTYDHERDLYVCPAGKELMHYRRQFQTAAHRRRCRGAHALPGHQAALRFLPSEGTLLPQARRPQGPALHPRGCSGHGTRHCGNRRLRRLTARAEEGRDAVRPPQAHPAPRPAAPARTTRRP